MVLGLGEGSLSIILEKNSYVEGEMINGKIKLNLLKPIEARGVVVELCADKRSGKTMSTTTYFTNRISGQRTYQPGEELTYSFKIPYVYARGVIGQLSLLLNPSPPLFYVKAFLDLPFKLDISEKTVIQISRAPE